MVQTNMFSLFSLTFLLVVQVCTKSSGIPRRLWPDWEALEQTSGLEEREQGEKERW